MNRFACLLLPLAAALLLAAAPGARAGTDFPLRAYYPEVAPISTPDLLGIYDHALILDVRSKFEYDVARINKAVLLPLTDPDFAARLGRLRAKDDPKPIVFYCNGRTCSTGYLAARIAVAQGFGHVFVHDAGIFDWIARVPEKATLMGETPARAARIIPRAEFAARQVDYDRFRALARVPDAVIIDIRAPYQRDRVPRVGPIRNIPLDPLLNLVVSRIWTEKRLLFFDASGTQVRWLQYFLESYGYFDYAFLQGGMAGLDDRADRVQQVVETDRSVTGDQDRLRILATDSRLGGTDRRVLDYLLAGVRFDNYAVLRIPRAATDLALTHALLLGTVRKLARLGYVHQAVAQDMLIVQVDPRLAWKGRAGDATWKAKLAEFEAEGQH